MRSGSFTCSSPADLDSPGSYRCWNQTHMSHAIPAVEDPLTGGCLLDQKQRPLISIINSSRHAVRLGFHCNKSQLKHVAVESLDECAICSHDFRHEPAGPNPLVPGSPVPPAVPKRGLALRRRGEALRGEAHDTIGRREGWQNGDSTLTCKRILQPQKFYPAL